MSVKPVLNLTLIRWLKKVPESDPEKEQERFEERAEEKQKRGVFSHVQTKGEGGAFPSTLQQVVESLNTANQEEKQAHGRKEKLARIQKRQSSFIQIVSVSWEKRS